MDVFIIWLPIIIALLLLTLIVVSARSVLESNVDGGAKVVWIGLIVFAPLLGSLLWFALSRTLALR